MEKHALRQQILKRLSRQPETKRLAKSLKIGDKVRRLSSYRKAKKILCYVSIAGEVETWPLLEQALADGKRIAVPMILTKDKKLVVAEIRNPEKELKRRGPLGIPEPSRMVARLNPDRLDLILVPGVAFDKRGNRLGRGGGYFDRFLAGLKPTIPRVGLAFKFQVVKKLPVEPHDQLVSKVITE